MLFHAVAAPVACFSCWMTALSLPVCCLCDAASCNPNQLHPALTLALPLPATHLPSPTHGLQGCLVLLQLLLLLPGC